MSGQPGPGIEDLERTIEQTRAELARDVDVLVGRVARRSRTLAIGVATVAAAATVTLVVLLRRGGRR